MSYNDIAQYVEPLLRASARQEEPWLRKLFRDPATYDTYSSLNNEFFLGGADFTGTLLVSSAARAEGRTTLAMLLAVLSGAFNPSWKVLLVDADVYNGRLAATFGLKGTNRGLRELFKGDASPAECFHPTALSNLWLTPRAKEPDQAVRISPKAFQAFIGEARSRFDCVIVDSPAGGSGMDVPLMASLVKNVLLVVKYGGPTYEQIQDLLANFKRVEARVLGAVLNQREYVVPRWLYGSK